MIFTIANFERMSMTISLDLVKNDEEFRNLQRDPIIVNDFKTDTQEEKDLILGKIMTKYNSDVMDSVPRCDCGNIHTPLPSTPPPKRPAQGWTPLRI